MTKVLIADGHPLMRMGLSMALRSTDEFYIQNTVGSTGQLFNSLENEIPDIVILEMDIPDVCSSDLTQKNQSRH